MIYTYGNRCKVYGVCRINRQDTCYSIVKAGEVSYYYYSVYLTIIMGINAKGLG